MKDTPSPRIQGQNSVDTEVQEIVGSGKPTGSVRKETIAVSATILIKRGKMTQPNPSRNSFMQQNERNASRTRSRGNRTSGRTSRWPCKDYLKKTCTNSFCEKWHPPECFFYKTKSGCRFGKSARMHIVRLMNSRLKGPKRMMTKVQWPCSRRMIGTTK